MTDNQLKLICAVAIRCCEILRNKDLVRSVSLAGPLNDVESMAHTIESRNKPKGNY